MQNLLDSYKQSIEAELQDLLSQARVKFNFADKLLESVQYSVLDGGKRLRPILSLVTAEAVLNSEEQLEIKENPAYGLALAMELVHCGSLIHDDLPCMDDDDLRRGRPSNHKVFGEATALLAGDFLLNFPIEVLITKTFETKTQISATKLNLAALKLSQAISGMIFGQTLDIELSGNEKFGYGKFDMLKQMEELKTGSLLTASVEIAALLAGANNEQLCALISYAKNLGLAFQIVDDILDCSSVAAVLGKSIGKDEQQNKTTYVRQYGVERSEDIAKGLITEAKELLDKPKNIYPDKLKLLADYVISRIY